MSLQAHNYATTGANQQHFNRDGLQPGSSVGRKESNHAPGVGSHLLVAPPARTGSQNQHQHPLRRPSAALRPSSQGGPAQLTGQNQQP